MRKKTENKRQVTGQPEYRTIAILYRDKNGGLVSGCYRTVLEVTRLSKRKVK